jgi:hypothetical protein
MRPAAILPTSRISPVALRLLSYYPLPNYSGIGLNEQATETVTNNWESILGKVDHRLSEKDAAGM